MKNKWDQLSETIFFDDESKGAEQVLEWAYQTFQNEEIIYASSFGAEAIVLIDIISQIKPDAQIVFLDTGLHFQETYDVIDQIKNRYGTLQIQLKEPEISLDKQRERYGSALWKREPNTCCNLRKVIPLREVLMPKKAWISGLRREQSAVRAHTQFFNEDKKFQNIKICPLIYWTWEEVWAYIRERDLPYNSLHDQGYPSIGCFPCTQSVGANVDSRAGRWSGNTKTECGLHTE